MKKQIYSTRNQFNKAFSVIELLVVIVIIGILATLVVVGYNSVVTETKKTAIKSDLRLAVDALALENNKGGKYPTSLAGITLESGNETSFQYSYIPDDRTFCLTASNGPLVFHALDKGVIIDGPCPGYTATAPVVSSLAGSSQGFNNGSATVAQFNIPFGIALNSSGNLYVVDNANNQIRLVTPAGDVSTFAGSTAPGQTDANGTSARFREPMGIVVVSNGDMYVTDTQNDIIRRITPGAQVSTFAGSGVPGFNNGTGTASVRFNFPTGITVDLTGKLHVADMSNHDIREITVPGAVVSTYSGNSPGLSGFLNGTGTNVMYNYPFGLATDSLGNMYTADRDNNQIRQTTPAGVTTTFAGSTTPGFGDGTSGSARFNKPYGVAVDTSNNIYVTDAGNNAIRKITPAGVVTTIAGGTLGYAEGQGSSAQFNNPIGIAVDSSGVIYVSDAGNHRIRKIVQ